MGSWPEILRPARKRECVVNRRLTSSSSEIFRPLSLTLSTLSAWNYMAAALGRVLWVSYWSGTTFHFHYSFGCLLTLGRGRALVPDPPCVSCSVPASAILLFTSCVTLGRLLTLSEFQLGPPSDLVAQF